MDYTTKLNCMVSVFHQVMAVAAIERAIGRKADKSANRGDTRSNRRSQALDRSSAYFKVVPDGEHEPQNAVSECLNLIERSSDAALLKSGEVWIHLGLLDGEFVQVTLKPSLIERLYRSGVGLVIENRKEL